MSYKKIIDGSPISADRLNRFIANGGHTIRTQSSFSGTSSYNFNNTVDNSLSATPCVWTRVVLSNMVAASGTALFVRLIDTAGTTIATNVYNIGYYGIDANGTTQSNYAAPTSVYNLGNISSQQSNWTFDLHHVTSGTNMMGYGQSDSGYPCTVNFGGICYYSALPIAGLNLITFGAVNFSGTISVYWYRRMV